MSQFSNTATDTPNVDPSELAKFSALAHRWWDKEGEFAALHQINPLRFGWIEGFAGLAGKRVLDVGCGGGILTDAMARKGADALGVDLATKSLRVAQLHALEAQTPHVHYREISVEELAKQEPGNFDVVTCMEMLEHVPDPSSVVRACGQLVKPGGWVFFSTINRNAKAFAFGIVGAEYLLGMVPRGTHDYQRFLKPAEIASWARDCRLDLRHSKGLSYNPLSRRFTLNEDMRVNYMLAMQRGA
jgi:2-polyprenyl-6-hydroxyphenyl methylase/3-demethylubiquinone-9 3-methyltransferase